MPTPQRVKETEDAVECERARIQYCLAYVSSYVFLIRVSNYLNVVGGEEVDRVDWPIVEPVLESILFSLFTSRLTK